MICLGIESTAHTFGIGVVNEKGEVLANVKDNFTTLNGGMVPNEASEHHVRVLDEVLKSAFETAKINPREVGLVAFSQSPGLGHCLRVGAFAARVLATRLAVPIVGVNHCIAHLEIGRLLTGATDPVLLYASGANTQVIAYEGQKYRIFGETLDIGIGNFLDSFARELGLGFPGGPKIAELASKGNEYIELPYNVKGMDVNFGGILTNLKQKLKSGKYEKEHLCFSVQETVFAMLVEVSERAMAHTGKGQLLLGGGVACNDRLQEMCRQMCQDRLAELFVPANEYLVDNAAMIAWQGLLEFGSGKEIAIKDAGIKPYLRTDQVEITWRD